MPFDLDTGAGEALLLARFAEGDREAARLLTTKFAPISLAFALRRIRDRAAAEDIAQEALLRLWKNAPTWEADRARISTWLYRVVANLCVDRMRKRQEVPLDPDGPYVDPAPAVETQILHAARGQALYTALADLPERQRNAVEMRHIEGLSNPEIAAVLEIGVEAVESLTARGKRALCAAFAGKRKELGFQDD